MSQASSRRPVEIFVDRLTLGSLIRATRSRGIRAGRLRVLQSAPGHGQRFAEAVARVLGWRVTSEHFFAGHLYNDAGESIYRVARRESGLVAFDAAADQVARVPALRRLNGRFGRETLRLFLTRRVWPDLERGFRVILVARALAGGDDRPVTVVVECPRYVDPRWLSRAAPNATVLVWGMWRGVVHQIASALDGLRSRRTRPTASSMELRADGSAPAVLLVQEEALGMDRSLRTQPHWIDPGAPSPIRTFVWARESDAMSADDASAAQAAGIRVVDDGAVASMAAAAEGNPLLVELDREATGLSWKALSSWRCSDALALSGAGKLLQRARLAAGLALATDARVFLCGENYLADAVALQLVAPSLNLRTISYQYSNISFVSASMMTTAELMLLFSPMYAVNWHWRGVGPQQCAALGYPYDGAFRRVAQRSAALRADLVARGVSLVIAFFDESVQHDCWGQIDAAEHRDDILQLADLVVGEPGIGVIVKTQFARNAPSQLLAGEARLQAAIDTGRFVECARSGGSRNVMFPAEAAQAADIVIGHAVGGTAVLEAALTGRRSLILNPNGWTGTWDQLYSQAHIVMNDMTAAIDAIARWRAGDTSERDLGDWTPIVSEFDAFRDGGAPARMARVVEHLAQTGDIAASVAVAGLQPVDRPLETDAA